MWVREPLQSAEENERATQTGRQESERATAVCHAPRLQQRNSGARQHVAFVDRRVEPQRTARGLRAAREGQTLAPLLREKVLVRGRSDRGRTSNHTTRIQTLSTLNLM